jgi:predicted DNA-binding WGR domain protein
MIDNAIEEALGRYFDRVSKEYDGIDREELQVLWTEVNAAAAKASVKVSISSKKKMSTSTTKTKSTPSEEEEVTGCPYMFQRGNKSGTACGATPKNGSDFCARHKKYEGKVQKERKILPVPKSIKPKLSKSSPVKKNVQRVLRKHRPTSRLWHPETGLAFKSARERVVVGKIVKNKFVPLEEEDVDTCKQWGYAFEPPVKEEEEPEVEESEGEEEPEESEGEEEPEESEGEEEDVGESKTVYLTADSASGGKFWEGTVDGNDFVTRYGKVGATGRTTTKTLSSNKEALKTLATMRAKKEKAGYAELAAPKAKSRKVTPKAKPKAKPKATKPKAKPKAKRGAVTRSRKKAASVSSEDEETLLEDMSGSEDELELSEKFVSKALGVNTVDDDESDFEEELEEEESD